jgi:adenylylsulfate kinase
MKNKGFVLWLTGLPCSGKTTLAVSLKKELGKRGINAVVLDGDDFRKSVSPDLGYSKKDRDLNIKRAGYIAKLLSENGVCVICAFVSPYRKTRGEVRKEVDNFIEIYVKASVDVCKKRDIKGLWKKAQRGDIKNLTGYDDPYEEPINAELVCDSEHNSPENNVEAIVDFLSVNDYL